MPPSGAVAVCLLHAYRNPAHERAVAEVLRARLPGVAISLSSDVASEFREYPRACTAVINAGLVPQVGAYLQRLDAGLERQGLAGARLVMQSSGGVSDFRRRRKARVHGRVGPGRGRDRGGALRVVAGRGAHPLLRHGRHDRQGRPDPGAARRR